MSADRERLNLAGAVSAVAGASSAAEVFRTLLEVSQLAGPRAALWLSRRGRLHLWSARGYPEAEVEALRRAERSAEEPPFAALLATAAAPVPAPGALLPGAGPAEEAVAVRLAVGGRPLGLLAVARLSGEPPLDPQVLAILATAACLRLELDLAWRKLQASARRETPAQTPAAAQRVEPPRAASAGSELKPAEPVARQEPKLEEAKRFARLVATDIRLYHEDDVVRGRQEGDLARRLRDELERGRETFQRRFPELGPAGLDLLREAYVQVLAGGDASLLPQDLF